MIFPRYHQLQAVRTLVDAARQRGRRPQLSRRALGRQRQEQHHRLAGASAGVAARRRESAGLRQRDRGDRPGRARPAIAGHDLPVRAQARRGAEDRRELAATGRGARERGAGHHHHAAEVSVRVATVAQDGRGARRERQRHAADAALRRDHRRGAQLAGRRDGHRAQGSAGRRGTTRGGAAAGGRRRPRRHGGAVPQHGQARPAGEPELLRLHGDAQAQDARRLRPRRAAGAPLHHAAGDRGRVHPRRAEALHDLRDLLQAAEGLRGRPERRAQEGGAGAGALHEAAPAQHRPEDRGDGRALQRRHAPQDRRPGQGDGGHGLAPGSRALQAELRSLHPGEGLSRSRRWWRSPARCRTTSSPTSPTPKRA